MNQVQRNREIRGMLKMTEVQSASDPKKRYEIRLGKDNVVYCTCPAWRFSKAPHKCCKHIVAWLGRMQGSAVMTYLEENATNWETLKQAMAS